MAAKAGSSDYSNGRELGLHEMFYDVMTGRVGTSNYFQYAVLRSNCILELKDVEESLERLIHFQPFLRMKVVSKTEEEVRPNCRKGRGNARLYYEPAEVKLEDVFRVRKSRKLDDLNEIVEEEELFLSREERYGDGVRWRVVLNMPDNDHNAEEEGNDFKGKEQDANKKDDENPDFSSKSHDSQAQVYKYEIMFVINHQFVDAVSGYDLVYRQFLPILNKIINKLPVDDMYLTPLELTPSYEEDILGLVSSADKKPAWYLKAIVNLVRAKNRAFSSGEWRPSLSSEGSPFFEEKGMGIFKFSLSEELVGRILHERKANDVSVHSILVTGMSFAIIRLMQDFGQPLPKKIGSGWPIDSRKKLAKFKSPQPLGMYIGTSGMTSLKVPKPYEFSREVFWHAASKIGRQVRKGVQNQREGLVLDMMAYFFNRLKNEDFGQFMAEIGLMQHFGISNLGKCAPGPELDTNLPKLVDADEIYFGLLGEGSKDVTVPFFNTVVNHKGRIFIVSCFCKKWCTREFTEKFLSHLEAILDEVCEGPK